MAPTLLDFIHELKQLHRDGPLELKTEQIFLYQQWNNISEAI